MNNKKVCCNIEQFKTYFLNHNYNENMFNNDGSINPDYNSNKQLELLRKFLKIIGISSIITTKPKLICIDLMHQLKYKK